MNKIVSFLYRECFFDTGYVHIIYDFFTSESSLLHGGSGLKLNIISVICKNYYKCTFES